MASIVPANQPTRLLHKSAPAAKELLIAQSRGRFFLTLSLIKILYIQFKMFVSMCRRKKRSSGAISPLVGHGVSIERTKRQLNWQRANNAE